MSRAVIIADLIRTQARQLKMPGLAASFEDLASKHSVMQLSRTNGGYVGDQVRSSLPLALLLSLLAPSILFSYQSNRIIQIGCHYHVSYFFVISC